MTSNQNKNFFNKKKILITGASGFIGRNLLDHISKYNCKIFALYKSSKLRSYKKNVSLIKSDLTKNIPKRILKIKFDIVIHLAGSKADRKSMMKEKQILNGILIDRNIINFSVKNGVTNFFYASTAGVYDVNDKFYSEKKISINYDADGIYGLTKLIGEDVLYRSFKKNDLNICRFFSIYGNDSKTIINIWGKKIKNNQKVKIWGDGKTIRSWIHISDVISGIIKILINKNKNIFYNLGSNEKLSLNTIFKTIKKRYPKSKSKKILYKEISSGPKNRFTNSENLKKIGWKQKIKLKEGIKLI
ncbi:NAD-dependent epimerase/dehydratase family protein [Candidatus Pelagibacter bacterium nBUS_25]|uniref:NAD-dependent epimerase/dehydratase family protein n=1 Tax=Candidatus Pelagibacter bacterium nBUS_25 TaxID=3374187 RepID=UPI003EBF8127